MLHLCYISPTLPVEFPFVQHAWTLGVVPLPTSVETPMSSVPVNLAAKPSSHQHFYLGSKPWNHSQSWVVKRVVDDTGKTPSHGWLWHSFYRFYPHIFFLELISTCSILADHQPLRQDDLTNSNSNSNSHRPSWFSFVNIWEVDQEHGRQQIQGVADKPPPPKHTTFRCQDMSRGNWSSNWGSKHQTCEGWNGSIHHLTRHHHIFTIKTSHVITIFTIWQWVKTLYPWMFIPLKMVLIGINRY